ncbi:MAG: type II secretion system F family protein [Planctomycetaceae bacterium]
MTTQHVIIVGLTSGLTFLAAFLAVLQLMQIWDAVLEYRFREPVARYLQLRMNDGRLARVTAVLVADTDWRHFVADFLRSGLPAGIDLLFLCSAAPPYVLKAVIKRREDLLEYQLIASATGLANALKAGLSVPQGLKTIAQETPVPLNIELSNIVYQFDHGRPLTETLAATRQRLQLEPFTLFCLALEVASERGGRVNVAMERLSTSLQEWFRLRRKLSSDTSAGRYAVLVMALCPLGFIGMFALTGQDSVYLLFTDLLGQVVLAIIILLICLGIRTAIRIMDIRLN